MTDDSPPSQVSSSPPPSQVLRFLPAFSIPASQRLDPPDPDTTVQDPHPDPVAPTDRYTPDDPRSVPTATRTGTSATGDVPHATPREVGELVAALLAAAAVAVGFAVRWRYRGQYRLRQPTKAHTEAVGIPLGRIAARHVPLGKLTPDLRDLVVAAVGVNDYLDAGPLRLPVHDAGVPDDLNQEMS